VQSKTHARKLMSFDELDKRMEKKECIHGGNIDKCLTCSGETNHKPKLAEKEDITEEPEERSMESG